MPEIEIFIPAVETVGVRNYRAPFLPVAHAVARLSLSLPLSLSLSLSHPSFVSLSCSQSPSILPFSRFRFFYLIGAAVIRTAFLFARSFSPFPLAHTATTATTTTTATTYRVHWCAGFFSLPPSPSFFSSHFFLFPSRLRAIRGGEAPDESRENTAYRFYGAQSF